MRVIRNIIIAATLAAAPASAQGVDALQQDMVQHGAAPARFIQQALDSHTLIIMDDGLHNLAEPWLFYEELITTEAFASRARHVFIETLNVNDQPHIDEFLATYPADESLLHTPMQNSTINGWRYASYIDLLMAIHAFNSNRTEEERIEVHAVSTPGYWREIETPADYANLIGIAQTGRDAFMYTAISSILDDMSGAERGIFLTNTRHAYTGLQDSDGGYFWNTATYFAQRHPGETYSIRINAPFLIVEREVENSDSPATGQGLERVQYSWGRAADGNWDLAFRAYGEQPVALDLDDTAFAQTPYIGNTMLRAAPGQTMDDVYDAVIFLGPVDAMTTARNYHQMYSSEFQAELARRYRAAYSPEDLARLLDRNGVETLEAYIETLAEPEPGRPSPHAAALPPLPD